MKEPWAELKETLFRTVRDSILMWGLCEDRGLQPCVGSVTNQRNGVISRSEGRQRRGKAEVNVQSKEHFTSTARLINEALTSVCQVLILRWWAAQLQENNTAGLMMCCQAWIMLLPLYYRGEQISLEVQVQKSLMKRNTLILLNPFLFVPCFIYSIRIWCLL